MAKNKAYFISDLHLGATYQASTRQKEHRIVDWLQSIADDAAELYLVGDILDYWYEYKTVVPRGYVRFFGQLAAMSDAGTKITWFIGNHDIWLFDYLRDEIGIKIIDGSEIVDIMGKKFFISHGDGLGKLPRSFKMLRKIFRNRFCQLLYGAIHPRWTIPFALNWSSHSRKADNATPPFAGTDEPLMIFAREYLDKHPDTDYFVFGHRHLLVDLPIGNHCRFIILGDWLNANSYAMFDGIKMELKSLNNEPIITNC